MPWCPLCWSLYYIVNLIVVFAIWIWPLPLILIENLAQLSLLMLSSTFSCLRLSNQSLPSRSSILNSHHWLHQIPSLNLILNFISSWKGSCLYLGLADTSIHIHSKPPFAHHDMYQPYNNNFYLNFILGRSYMKAWFLLSASPVNSWCPLHNMANCSYMTNMI